jgi:NAD(P)-dependent dehydrogenase (short-subunit alcohol dehydrogenase family)
MAVEFSLKDQVAVITGASRGIGEAIARTFARQGAKVAISSRKQDALDAVADSIKQAGGEALAVALIMMQQKKGCIINVASIAGIQASPMQGVYGMTKAAVILMTKSFAKELGPFGVRANAICPGLTATKFAKVLIDTKAIYDAAMTMVPMKRHAEPDEIAGAALYLASAAGSYANGSIIVVDGGATA